MKFFNFYPLLGQEKYLFRLVQKYPGESWLGPLFISGQKFDIFKFYFFHIHIPF